MRLAECLAMPGRSKCVQKAFKACSKTKVTHCPAWQSIGGAQMESWLPHTYRHMFFAKFSKCISLHLCIFHVSIMVFISGLCSLAYQELPASTAHITEAMGCKGSKAQATQPQVRAVHHPQRMIRSPVETGPENGVTRCYKSRCKQDGLASKFCWFVLKLQGSSIEIFFGKT